MTCVSNIPCQGQAICHSNESNTDCLENCPAGYSMQTLYEDYDITDINYSEARRSNIKLKTCIKN